MADLGVRWSFAIATAIALSINACPFAVSLLPRPRWDDRLQDRLRADDLRAACDRLMGDRARHGEYWNPQANGVPATHRTLEGLLPAIRELDPDRVTVDQGGVSLEWQGET